MRNIRVDADVFEHLNAIARPDETAGEALQRMLAGHVIEVDDDTYAELVARSETFGESASEVIRRVLGLDEGPPPVNQPGLVTFHIAHGTGAGPWNTQATAIRVGWGNLRIVNDDDVGHLLHTTAPRCGCTVLGDRRHQHAPGCIEWPSLLRGRPENREPRMRRPNWRRPYRRRPQ
jgi:SeqA protein N-terminal domain